MVGRPVMSAPKQRYCAVLQVFIPQMTGFWKQGSFPFGRRVECRRNAHAPHGDGRIRRQAQWPEARTLPKKVLERREDTSNPGAIYGIIRAT